MVRTRTTSTISRPWAVVNPDVEALILLSPEMKDRGFDDMSTEDQIADLNIRVSGVEGLLGIDPDDEKSLDKVAKALDDAGYEKPEPEEAEEE